jgi:hypothetical protein
MSTTTASGYTGGSSPQRPSSAAAEGAAASALRRLARAVERGKSAATVRSLIDECAQQEREQDPSSSSTINRRSEAANQRVTVGANRGWTLLDVAHLRLGRADLVAALVESGADVPAAFSGHAPRDALVLCIHYGLAGSLRVILANKWRAANEKLPYWTGSDVHGCPATKSPFPEFCRPAHLCVVPPRPLDEEGDDRGGPKHAFGSGPIPPPQLECLQVLLEFGGGLRATDFWGNTPLHWLGCCASTKHKASVLEVLLRHGGDLDAQNAAGQTLLLRAVIAGDLPLVKMVLSQGASADIADAGGLTPLMHACRHARPVKALVATVLAATSEEARRAVELCSGWSAVDFLATLDPSRDEEDKDTGASDEECEREWASDEDEEEEGEEDDDGGGEDDDDGNDDASSFFSWRRQVLSELIASGTPFQRDRKHLVARLLGESQEAELGGGGGQKALRRAALVAWRAAQGSVGGGGGGGDGDDDDDDNAEKDDAALEVMEVGAELSQVAFLEERTAHAMGLAAG